MAKSNGLGQALYVSGYDLGDDIQQFATRCPIGTHDVTPITKSAMERLYGQRDGGITATAFFNDAAGRAHPRLSALPSADQLITVSLSSTQLVSVVAKQLNYDGNRAADGMLTFATDHTSNAYALEYGIHLTGGKRTDTGATDGASVDLGSASPGAFGAVFHLHVFAFTGTDATIKIQESSDNGAGDAWADVVGATFTQITSGPTWQRIATAAIAVERYLRVVTTTSGGFSNLQFLVQGHRHPAQAVI
ncbi:MAG TPA: hypothetical protein VGX25_05395 [Actinophytocola sp.]|uniref:hypothetical protein n=1 Tax=Actinophytocola sp. TaxID=1872138 RepID=UPI002DDCBF35|nr:hypothetical protein [Actinophytocola sp.]HEV2778817.1 hypothetical protein [Actinophytocola sp.]